MITGWRARLALRLFVALVCGAAVEATLVVASIDAAAGLRDLPGRPAGDLAGPLGDVATVVALLAWTWLLLLVVTTALAALGSAGRPHPEGLARRLAPAAARQAVLGLLGLGTVLASTGAVSAAGHESPRSVAAVGVRFGADDSARANPLQGLPLPDRPAGVGRPQPAPRDEPTAAVVVRPGDSLWAIASRALGDHPSTAAIAASWPQWYAANRAVIGPDPDLLLPGTVLEAPTKAPSAPHPTLPPNERP